MPSFLHVFKIKTGTIGKMNSIQESTPKGLYTLIFLEFVDRFGFCGSLTILLLYLKDFFSYSNELALSIWGAYLALSYITPVIGGYLADRILGFGYTILLGLLALITGFTLLSLSSQYSLYVGLSFVLCGIGLFKGNVSSMVGMLYEKEDSRKQHAYSQLFMGITLGAILGPLVFGLLSNGINWHAGFLLSALLNMFSLVLFLFYRNKFILKVPSVYLTFTPSATNFFISFNVIAVAFLASGLFAYAKTSNEFIGLFSLLVEFGLIFYCLRRFKEAKNALIGLAIMSFILVSYYAASQQINGSVMLAISTEFNMQVVNWQITPTIFASLEAFFAFLLCPILVRLWRYLETKQIFLSPLAKINYGLIAACFSFLIFAFVFYYKVHPVLFLILANLLLGLSVACIFPTHMALVSAYAPPGAQGMCMGMSFLSSALAGYLSSMMALGDGINQVSYSKTYSAVAYLMLGTCIVLLLLTPWLKVLFYGKTQPVMAND